MRSATERLSDDVIDRVNALITDAEYNITHLDEGEYLSMESVGYLAGRVTLVEAGTGAGKSTHVLNRDFTMLGEDTKHVNLSLPLVSLLMNKENSHTDIKAHYGRDSNKYLQPAPMTGLTTMGTPESLKHLEDASLANTALFIDEIQYLVDAQSYRKGFKYPVENAIQNADTVVMLGATLYREALLPFVDDYQIFKQSEAQQRNVQIMIKKAGQHKTAIESVEFMVDASDLKNNVDNFFVVLMENKAHIEILKDSLINTYGFADDEVITYISPESDITAKNTPEAEEMIVTGHIPETVKVLLWTSAALVGVDMYHDGYKEPLCIFNDAYTAKPEVIAQMAGRFRDVTSAECVVFMGEAAYERDFEEVTTFDYGRTLNALRRDIKTARLHYQYHRSATGLTGTRAALLTERGKVSTLGCMLYIQKAMMQYTSHSEFYERFNINLVDVNRHAYEFDIDETATWDALEDLVITKDGPLALDIEEVDAALASKDISKLGENTQHLIKVCGLRNVNAKNRLFDIHIAMKRYNDPVTARYANNPKKPLSLKTLNNKAMSHIEAWLIRRKLREKLLQVLTGEHTLDEVIDTIHGCKVSDGYFPSARDKTELMKSLRAKRKGVTVLKRFIGFSTVKRGHAKTVHYVFNAGLPTAVLSSLKLSWIEERYDKFFIFDDNESFNADIVAPLFDNLDSAA